MRPFVITSILAATDLGETSVAALRYARTFTERFSAKLTVMYTDPIGYPLDFVGPSGAFYVNATPEHEARMRGEVGKQAAAALGGVPYDINVTVGQPIPAILAVAREKHADLIVVGKHSRHGWRRALLGSVSDGVTHGSSCPVLTVGERGRSQVQAVTKILCPVNFTDVARDALHAATRLASAFDAALTIVHVLESDEVMNVAGDEERVRSWIAPEMQEACSYRELIVRGGAAERVLDCADDLSADLIVLGAQHKLFRDATVIGTTSERLIRFATCPVLVVPREAVSRHKAVEEKSANELVAS